MNDSTTLSSSCPQCGTPLRLVYSSAGLLLRGECLLCAPNIEEVDRDNQEEAR